MIQIMVNRHTRKTTGPILFYRFLYHFTSVFSTIVALHLQKHSITGSKMFLRPGIHSRHYQLYNCLFATHFHKRWLLAWHTFGGLRKR